MKLRIDSELPRARTLRIAERVEHIRDAVVRVRPDDGTVLTAGSGDDIMIAGSTSYDNNITALLALSAEWGRTDANYATRVAHLQGTLSGGLNGSYRLTATTVHDDSVMDSLFGGAGLDWFFVSGTGKKNQDKVYNQTSGEVITTL